jgi:DNA-binding transcriptional MerR regulator
MLQSWTAEQAARIIGIPYRTLRRWLADGLVSLRLHRHPVPRERLRLVQEDVEELWAIASLRLQGVPMQRIKRILVRLAGMRLSDFKAVVVQGQDVIGVPFDERMPSARLSDGQAVIRLEALRERLRDNPGEVLGEAWELMLQAEEARFV